MKSKRHLVSSQAQSTRRAPDPGEPPRPADPGSKKSEERGGAQGSPKGTPAESGLDYAQLRQMLEAGLASEDPDSVYTRVTSPLDTDQLLELQRKLHEDVRMKNKQLSKLNQYHMPRLQSRSKRAVSGADRPQEHSDEERSVRSGRAGSADRKFEKLQADLARIEQKLRQAEDADRYAASQQSLQNRSHGQEQRDRVRRAGAENPRNEDFHLHEARARRRQPRKQAGLRQADRQAAERSPALRRPAPQAARPGLAQRRKPPEAHRSRRKALRQVQRPLRPGRPGPQDQAREERGRRHRGDSGSSP